jgi:hypothetical protein
VGQASGEPTKVENMYFKGSLGISRRDWSLELLPHRNVWRHGLQYA